MLVLHSVIFLIGILIFLLLRSPCKISEPYDNPFWYFSNGGERKRKINLPKIVAYISCSAGRTHFARTNMKGYCKSGEKCINLFNSFFLPSFMGQRKMSLSYKTHSNTCSWKSSHINHKWDENRRTLFL